MIEKKICITVTSQFNEWMDLCILVAENVLDNALEIIQKAYDEWWECPDANDEPFADWVGNSLTQNGIEYVVKLNNGKAITLTQGNDVVFTVGQPVYVLDADYGERARIIAR